MIVALRVAEILLWVSLLGILAAIAAILLLPQYGPMPVALNRVRVLLFAEVMGLLFAILYALSILRVLV